MLSALRKSYIYMKYRYLIAIMVGYGLIGTGGYMLVRTLAVGAADAGVAGPTGLRLLGLSVDYILLQPLALELDPFDLAA